VSFLPLPLLKALSYLDVYSCFYLPPWCPLQPGPMAYHGIFLERKSGPIVSMGYMLNYFRVTYKGPQIYLLFFILVNISQLPHPSCLLLEPL
jgi:hypothetical protein